MPDVLSAPTTAITPIALFISQLIALEAAVLRTAADPRPSNVHHLRTNTRRLEAQLELLAGLPELQDQLARGRKTLRAVHSALRSLRREAGWVRDMDVQCDLLECLAQDAPGTAIEQQANTLADDLKARRKHEAKTLARMLEKHGRSITRELEAVRALLEDAEETALAPERLHQIANRWYAEQSTPGADPGEAHDELSRKQEDTLHDARKRAKLARYLLEAKAPGITDEGPKGAVRDRAKAFERLQGAGGAWHDLLTLAELAREFHGKKAELTRELITRRDQALARYRDQLRSFDPAA